MFSPITMAFRSKRKSDNSIPSEPPMYLIRYSYVKPAEYYLLEYPKDRNLFFKSILSTPHVEFHKYFEHYPAGKRWAKAASIKNCNQIIGIESLSVADVQLVMLLVVVVGERGTLCCIRHDNITIII